MTVSQLGCALHAFEGRSTTADMQGRYGGSISEGRRGGSYNYCVGHDAGQGRDSDCDDGQSATTPEVASAAAALALAATTARVTTATATTGRVTTATATMAGPP